MIRLTDEAKRLVSSPARTPAGEQVVVAAAFGRPPVFCREDAWARHAGVFGVAA